MAMSGNHKFGVKRSFAKQGHVTDVHALIGEQLGQEYILDGSITPSSFIETNVDILCVKYTANHEYLAVGFTDGYVRLFIPSKGECVFSLMDTELLENPVPVSDIKHRYSSRGNLVPDTITTSYVNGSVKGWKYESGDCVYTIREHRQTLGLEFHRRSPKFLTVGNDSIIYMYDEETRTQEQVFKSSNWAGLGYNNFCIMAIRANTSISIHPEAATLPVIGPYGLEHQVIMDTCTRG